MKRLLLFFLSALMVFPTVACTTVHPVQKQPSDTATSADTTVNSSETTAALTTESTEAAETPAKPPVDLPQKEHLDPSSTRLLSMNILDLSGEGSAEEDEPLCIVDTEDTKYTAYRSTEYIKTSPVSLRWSYSANRSMNFFVPKDISAYQSLSFWFYADASSIGETFLIYFQSENTAAEDGDYFQYLVTVEREGWTECVIDLTQFTATRNPVGWNKIDFLEFKSTGWDQTNRTSTVLYLDSIYLHTVALAKRDTSIPGLDGAAAFSLGGSRAVVDQKQIRISLLDESSTVYEENGIVWLPLSVFAASLDPSSDYNASTHTLHMTYEGTAYTFVGGRSSVEAGGAAQSLDFTVAVRGDSLFVPHTYVQKLFGYTEMYTDALGNVILSRHPIAYDFQEDMDTLLSISYATRFHRPSGEQIVLDMYDHLGGDVHPRIMLTQEDFDRLSGYLKTDNEFKKWYYQLEKDYNPYSVNYMDKPVEYALPDGRRLLEISREAKNRIIPWCFLYRVGGNEKFAERAWQEVEALCNFKDWHPTHFLDTAEICYAMAIAYDWLYDYLTEAQKRQMEEATLTMGILPGLNRHEMSEGMFGTNNWNGVCNGGLTAAALAYATVYPQECTRLLGYTVRRAEAGMHSYAPDGGYKESHAYWSYGTDYLHVLISSLDSACGTDYGLYKSPGFAQSAYMLAHLETEIGTWGFHDAGSGGSDTSTLSWFAKKSVDPSLNRLRRNGLDNSVKKIHVYDLMWYDPSHISDAVDLSLDAYYSAMGIVTMRDTWEKKATLVGLHGGDNSASHGDLDIGNFILDADGHRYFMDLGLDNYNLPGYAGAERFQYYKKRAEGQNTLVIGDVSYKVPDQEKKAVGEFIRVESGTNSSIAVLDMSAAYANVTEGKRGILFTDNRSVIVLQDEMTLESTTQVRWSAHTKGKITIGNDGRTAQIQVGSDWLYCEIVCEDPSFVFSSGGAVSYDKAYPKNSKEDSRSGIHKLMILSDRDVQNYKLAVVFKPMTAGETNPTVGSSYTWSDMSDWQLQP